MVEDVSVVPDAESSEASLGPNFRPADLIVQHLDIRLRLILLIDATDEDALSLPTNLAAAALILRHWPETTAVGLVANDADLSCLLLEPFDVEPSIAAPSGEALPPTPRRIAQPIGSAVAQYLNVVVPSWDAIPPAEIPTEPFRYEDVALRIARSVRETIRGRRANIDEKRSALDSLSEADAAWAARLVERAVSLGMSEQEIAIEVSRRAGKT
jgi:hypothetical protein